MKYTQAEQMDTARAGRKGRQIGAVWLIAALMLTGLQQPARAGPDEGCLTGKINAERQAQGARSLTSNANLVSIARRHSARMAEDQRYYHNGNLRNELPSGWRSEGENVGWATDCAHMHNFFMNSPSHRKNILNGAFNQIGVGVVTDSAGKLWVTEVFMESSGAPGLSTESRAALNAPPSEPSAVPPQQEGPPPPSPPGPTVHAEEINKSTPRPASPARAASPAAAKRASAKKTEPAAAREEAEPQPPEYAEILAGEPGWHDPGADGSPIIFDLEQSVGE